MTPLEVLLPKLGGAKKSGKGWSARCPAHEDGQASLSVSEGNDGKVLMKCHAGCETPAILAAIGLSMSDLFPPKPGPIPNRTNGPTPKGRVFTTDTHALKILEHNSGKPSAVWTYHDADGQPVGHVVRWDTKKGKDIRPVARHADGWRIGAMPDPRPLYGLPDLAGATRVVVAEGEKATEAARNLGFVATTSAGGAQAGSKTDWRPLAGKEVWVLPDNDIPGHKYADTVADILAKLNPPSVVRIVELPGLPDGGDVVDWIDAHGEAAEPEAMRAELEGLASASPIRSQAVEPWPEIESFDAVRAPEFPTHVLPDALRKWVEAESYATQTPADLAALLALAVIGAMIARRVVVMARPGWREPVNLYVAVLLEPGNRKSAVFTDAMRPIRELEAELIELARPSVARELSARRQSEARLRKLEKQAAEKDDAEARRHAGDLAAELARTAEPVLPRLIVDDSTSEKLGIMLAQQGGRMASMSPEGGVFDLMAGLYSKSGIPQFGVYLMGHSGDDLITDRVSRESVRVERPALTCAYAMQPAVIEGLAENAAFRGRGLLARFMYSAPESWIGRREIATPPVSDEIREGYRHVVRRLANLEGEQILELSADASAALRAWEGEIEEMLGDGGQMEIMRDWGAKLAGATLRIAAVLHCAEKGPSGQIDRRAINAAKEIAQYLVPHAEAVMAMMQATEESADDDALYVLKWIERHCKRQFTKRDAQQHGKRRFPEASSIDAALAELVRRGYIRLRPAEAKGPGRPPSPAYDVNPAVFVIGEPKERSHNSQNSAEASENASSQPIEGASTKGPANTNSENNENASEEFESEGGFPDETHGDGPYGQRY